MLSIEVDDEVLATARLLAELDAVTLNEAVLELARFGGRRMCALGIFADHDSDSPAGVGDGELTGEPLTWRIADDGWPIIDVPPGFPKITDEDVARMLNDFP